MSQDSIFTKIINGEIPSYKIYENENVYAFLDINPLQPGHTLVVPKVQVENLWELDDKDYQALTKTVKKLALHMQNKLSCARVGSIVEGFEVPHAHIHLIPLNQGLRATFSLPRGNTPTEQEFKEMTELLALT